MNVRTLPSIWRTPLTLETVSIERRDLAFRTPLRTTQLQLVSRPSFLIRITAQIQGTTCHGLGEAAPIDGWLTESVSQCGDALRRFAAEPGPFSAQEVWKNDILRDNPAAQFGIETACLDLIARFHDKPLSEFIDDKAETSFPVNATVSCGAEDGLDTLADVEALVDQGFRCIKLKAGNADWRSVSEELRTWRERLGSQLNIRLDVNRGWTHQEAIAGLSALEPLDLEYVEEPIVRPTVESLQDLCTKTQTPIALDETLVEPEHFEPLLKAQTPRVLIIKPTVVGGLGRAHLIAQLGQSYGLDVVLTSSMESWIGRVATAHLVCGLGLTTRASGLATGMWLEESGRCQDEIRDGHYQLPSGPGLGKSLVDELGVW